RPLPDGLLTAVLQQLAIEIVRDGEGAARAARITVSEAITTTDRWPKRVTVRIGGITLSAQAKGAGMIEPDMATMLCFVQTDAVLADPAAELSTAVDASFNRITVDGQMSTNDCVLLQATGAAGRPLPDGLLTAVLQQLAIEIVRDGEGAARAARITVSAQAKGAGMIEPNMATMLCFVQTDAVVADPDAALRRAVDASFNRITVDGQMSTNDTVLLQATGTSGEPLPEGLLDALLLQLAIEIVRDGEGAARAGRIEVSGAADQAEAERVARAIANSPLVKTALYGRDPNWGRIAQAAGAALAGADLDEIGSDSIDAAELGADTPEANIGLRLDRGTGRAHVYFSDLGHEYVTLNAEYTT
ncbi:MAG TPA: bifunctional ornithine acetyltransferase/N-acetylglutamate synthase, partial [Solirubrobacterales bacterium]|nr:bifunctional ornithine acetyltransferase/N-acetylglutamate synthase [Solirubrobacterales bacterium]